MVTLQILVLSFLVRIQVAQLKREQHNVVLFFFVGLLAVIYIIPPILPLIREACGNAPHCSPLAKYKTYIQPIGSTAKAVRIQV